jgi:uncharacterized protein Yka (UPF0111/DUF47 family)
MVFPAETEDRTLRNLFMLIQDNVRLTVEAFRKILAYIDSFTKPEEELKNDTIEDMKKIISEANILKLSLIKELHEIGGILTNREDFFRLINSFGFIMDHIDVMGIRLLEIKKEEWNIPENIVEGLSLMADLAFKALTMFREAIISLGFDSNKTIRFAQQIEEIEHNLDLLYVQTDFQIIKSNANLPVILILRDVANLIEEMVDSIQKASYLIRIIGI